MQSRIGSIITKAIKSPIVTVIFITNLHTASKKLEVIMIPEA